MSRPSRFSPSRLGAVEGPPRGARELASSVFRPQSARTPQPPCQLPLLHLDRDMFIPPASCFHNKPRTLRELREEADCHTAWPIRIRQGEIEVTVSFFPRVYQSGH